MRNLIMILITAITAVIVIPILAQKQAPRSATITIEEKIEHKDFYNADSLLKEHIYQFKIANKPDSILQFISLTGKLALVKTNLIDAQISMDELITQIKSLQPPIITMVNAYREEAEFYAGIGQNKKGFEASTQALNYVLQMPVIDTAELAQCKYNLGAYAQRLGDINLSQKYHRESLFLREHSSKVEEEDLYLSNNAMGAVMWYGSKYDSATIYYNHSLNALKKMPDDDMNSHYRPSIVLNNLAALYSMQGKTTDAIIAMESVISHLQQFIASKKPHPKKLQAETALLEAVDNLGGIYKEIGDYGKAGDLLNYAYQQKLKKLTQDNPGIFISEILLGQHFNDIREFDSAIVYFNKGYDKLLNAEGDYLVWAADANHGLALAYEAKKDTLKAAMHYEKAEQLFDSSYQGEYDNTYMDFMRNTSLFYASINKNDLAIEKSLKVYQYLQKVGEEKGLQGFYQLLNLATIYFMKKNYSNTISYSKQALTVVNTRISEGATLLDSVKMEVFKPKAILINAKAEYALKDVKDSVFLNAMAERLTNALSLVEKRKVLLDDDASINIMIADNMELIDFLKFIELQLYNGTGNVAHLNKLINLHESGLYNRLRSQLEKQSAISFANLPDDVQVEEEQLKNALRSSLLSGKPQSQAISDHIKATSNWNEYLARIKNKFPEYYRMRYATIFKTMPQLQAAIPANTTLVRYIFIDTALYAFVADSSREAIVKLDPTGVDESINRILQNAAYNNVQSERLANLYTKLWSPVQPYIHSKKVMIIPDRGLFNLSFEMLTEVPITSNEEMVDNCLLSKYIISYHYSLFMLGYDTKELKTGKNYIGFAPGFSDDIKEDYVKSIDDSVNLDFQYLSLLPQPSINKLTKKIGAFLDGETYLNAQSTKAVFTKYAGGNKIVHIGTHAEYNNLRPERSRLIFAKKVESTTDSNSLYLSEIYGNNFNSALTILTACETGKPGYQDGEGMLSLAYAFNYAGSKSILTSLWKIDEQSSSTITDYFIGNLKNGEPTDEALQNAKLKYLHESKGRLLAPAYWAGLILMGEPDTIDLKSTNNYLLIFGMVGVGILLLYLFFKNRMKK